MKILLPALLLSLCAVWCSCKKDKADATKLQGKWKLTEYYMSTGGPGQWTAVTPKKDYDYLQFDSDGRLEGTLQTDYNRYTIKDSVTLVLYKPDNTIENFSYSLKNGVLTMSPAGPVVCIEGCGNRFAKLKD